MRRQVMWAVDLNVGNGEKPVTMEDVRKAVRADLESLTRMADERNFHCVVAYVLSDTDPMTGKKAHPHCHMVVFGTPASEIAKTIKFYWVHYWSVRGYKINPTRNKAHKVYTDGRLSYMWTQRHGNFCIRLINYAPQYASELFNVDADAASYYLRPQGLTRNVLLAWLDYMDEDEKHPISVTDYPMIREFTRPYDSAYLRYLGVLDDYKKHV